MSKPERIALPVQAFAASKKRSGLQWGVAALVMLALTAGIVSLRYDVTVNARQDIVQGEMIDTQGRVITSLSRDSQRLRGELVKRGVNPNTIAPAPEKRLTQAPGATGTAGLNGVSISRVAITADGQLQVFYSDGSSQTVGNIVGATGATGAAGRQGPQGDSIRGISGVGGTNGVNGVDSIVPGPAGPVGPVGPASVIPGPSGPACPSGFTFSRQLLITEVGARTVMLCVLSSPLPLPSP